MEPCFSCIGEFGGGPTHESWQTRCGRKLGVKRKSGEAKTGPKEFEDRGELKQIITLSFKANDIEKAGGRQKAKEYLEKKFYELIK